jgi:hypothetical protein
MYNKLGRAFAAAAFVCAATAASADELKMDKETQASYCVFKQQLFSVGAVLCRGAGNFLKCDAAASGVAAVAHWTPIIGDEKGVCGGMNTRD